MTRTDLARQILTAAARDQNAECCCHVDEDKICVIRKSHAANHKYEPVRKVIPFE
jgi:hypothetical protein